GPSQRGFWHRWSHVIQAHPWPAAILSVVLLLILAVPTLSLRLGFGDAGNRPTTDTSRRAYDLLSTGFGPGFNGPFVLAAETPDKADMAVLQKLSETLNHTDGIAFASPPVPSSTGQAALISIIPSTSPQDAKTAKLVHRLRDDIIPPAIQGTSTVVKVGGVTAGAEDFATYTGERMPYFFAAVLALSFILLMVVFRSVLVPLKAVIMNLLSIGVAFGAMVAVFQWGWGASLLGIGKEGPIEAWAPLMLFAIVFGLSMDYEVFLLSRIREEYDKTNDNASAVADGLAATARVITAAAAIMVCVFSSFILGDDRSLKLFGFGLAVAVFIDATVVRLVLVPATMELLGRANWWMPRWLSRILPSIRIEGDASDLSTSESATTAP
ncbi:MAG: MMPL family transporter, partial [Tepidiformaceae bacterium]